MFLPTTRKCHLRTCFCTGARIARPVYPQPRFRKTRIRTHVAERVALCRAPVRVRTCMQGRRRRRRRLRVRFHGYRRRGIRAVRLQPHFDDDVRRIERGCRGRGWPQAN